MTWDRLKARSQVHDAGHARARREWAERHHPEDRCAREHDARVNCPGGPLGPMGRHLHLDHDDHDKTRYIGFSHAACNLAAAGQLGRHRQKQARLGSRTRDW